MTETSLSKKMRAFDGEGAIGVAQLLFSPHVAAYLAGRVHRAVPPLTRNSSSGAFTFRPCPRTLSQKLTRPLVTKDGSTLRMVLDARAYMLALPKRRETAAQWQRAAELLLDGADVAAFSKAVELALFYDAKLDLAT